MKYKIYYSWIYVGNKMFDNVAWWSAIYLRINLMLLFFALQHIISLNLQKKKEGTLFIEYKLPMWKNKLFSNISEWYMYDTRYSN